MSINANTVTVVLLTDLNAPLGPFTTSGCANDAELADIDPQTGQNTNQPLVAEALQVIDIGPPVGFGACTLSVKDPYGASASLTITGTAQSGP